jgi:hypothetical protein
MKETVKDRPMIAILKKTCGLALLLTLLLTGCLQPRNKAVVKNNPYRASVNGDLKADWLKTYRDMTDEAKKKERRNEILNEFVWLADDAYYQWEPQFYASGATVATVLDFASLGLTGATTVANSPKVLGAMATGIQGASGSISKNFYDQQSRSVIVQKMRQLRDAALARIADGQKQATADYSLDQGIVDIQNYYYAGTVTAALQGLATSTAAQHEEDKNTLDAVRKGAPRPAQTPQAAPSPTPSPTPQPTPMRLIR